MPFMTHHPSPSKNTRLLYSTYVPGWWSVRNSGSTHTFRKFPPIADSGAMSSPTPVPHTLLPIRNVAHTVWPISMTNTCHLSQHGPAYPLPPYLSVVPSPHHLLLLLLPHGSPPTSHPPSNPTSSHLAHHWLLAPPFPHHLLRAIPFSVLLSNKPLVSLSTIILCGHLAHGASFVPS